MAEPHAAALDRAREQVDEDLVRARDAGRCDARHRAVHDHRCAALGEAVLAAVATRLAEYPERSDLTERELEVLELVAKGLSNKEVAQAIGRMDETVKIHLKNIFSKLGVADRTEAVTVALARGLIHLD